MPWWSEQNNPEPDKEEPVAAMEVEPAQLSTEDKTCAWRLLMLLDSLRVIRPHDPVSLDEIDQLGQVARGNHDLHAACAALEHGCALDLLVIIFT